MSEILDQIAAARRQIEAVGGLRHDYKYLIGSPQDIARFLKKLPDADLRLGVEVRSDVYLPPAGRVVLMEAMPTMRQICDLERPMSSPKMLIIEMGDEP